MVSSSSPSPEDQTTPVTKKPRKRAASSAAQAKTSPPPSTKPRKKPTTTTPPPAPATTAAPIIEPAPAIATTLADTVVMAPSVIQEKQQSLFEDPTFMAFWLSRFLGQTAQGALMYGLLVLVVDGTDSSFMNSLFVVCAVIPAIVFGLPAGVVVDAMPKRMLLVSLNILRFVFVLSFALSSQSVEAIFAVTLAIWILHQFYAPAESATLASIVPVHRLTEAQAASNMALVTAQAIGLIILAPILLKTSAPTYLFVICASLFLTASFLTMQLGPKISMARRRRSVEKESVGDTLLTGARVLFGDPLIFRVSTIDVIVGIGLSALVVIAPLYLRRILDTSSENTVFVFAPAAIGVILGLKTAPWLASKSSLRIVATAGLLVFAFSIAAFGFMNDLYDLMENTLGLPISNIAATLQIAPLALLVMFFSIPAGFSSSVVGVAARSVTLMRAPEDTRGQVIATQSLAQNLGALLPTLLAGVAADAIGVERVAVAIAIIMLGTAAVAFLTQKQVPVLPTPPNPGMA